MTTNKTIRKRVTFRLSEEYLKEEARKANKSLNSFVESILTDVVLKTSEGYNVLKKNDTEV